MAVIPGSTLQERFLSTAKELVSRDLGLLGRQGESWDLAGDLHRLGGEAAMVNLPEVAQAAREGEEAAHLLGSASDRQARVTCGRLLRKLSYLLQELSAKRPTPVPTEARRATGGGRRVLVVDDSPVAAQALADVQMPNLDVVELCQRFREVMRGQRTAILLISGRSEAELRDRLDVIRPEAFVSKLAGADAVVSRVAAFFQGFQE